MARSRFALARTSWLATPRPTRRAVEKPEPWTPWKTNPRFSPAPTAPWKTRKGSEFPTFPPPRRFLLFLQSKTKGEEDSMKTRPDNYRVNKTGQLKKLTTGSGGSGESGESVWRGWREWEWREWRENRCGPQK